MRAAALLVLVAALGPSPAWAETRIQDFYLELQGRLARLPADPFEPEALERHRATLLAGYAGQELRIPKPPPGIERRGSAQGLWPLDFLDGRLWLRFPATGGYAPLMEDSPWNWWSSDRSGPADGQRSDDGRSCRQYTARSGYGLRLAPPRSVLVYVNDGYRLPGSEARQRLQDGEFNLELAGGIERARGLSGGLATYIRLDRLEAIEQLSRADTGLRVSSTGHCYGGEQRLLVGRIDRLRIQHLGSGEDLIRLRFEY